MSAEAFQPKTAPAIRRRSKKEEEAVVHSSKTSFKGKVFSVTTDKVTEPGGVTSTRDVIRHNGSVVVLAVDRALNGTEAADDPLVIVIRQYRFAANQFLYELPAGRIDAGEAPLAAAKRELIEETGVRARKWSKLVSYYASPGFLAETMEIFLAEGLTFGEAKPEEDEKIELFKIPLSELLGMIKAGKVKDGKTIVGALAYKQFFS